MKNIYKIFAVILVMLASFHSAFPQETFYSGPEITVYAGDSVVIRLNDYEGTIQWQKSFDNNEWENISGAVYDTLLFISDATTYFRAEVIAGFCDPFFSDIVKVNVITGQPGEGVADIDGNHYPSVVIGNQEWMAENLKTTKYRNGVAIDYPGSNNSEWENNTTGAYAWYQNVPTWKDKYGALYNWYAVNNSNGLCPTGWHVPSDAEWTGLVNYLETQGYPNDNIVSGAGNALKSCRQKNSPLGGDCNTTEHPRWNSGWGEQEHYGFDEFGFSALPGSSRYLGGTMYDLGNEGYWWSSRAASDSKARHRSMNTQSGSFLEETSLKAKGYSVRCVRYIGTGMSPTLTTLPVSEFTDISAFSGGNILSDGNEGIIARGLVWSTITYPSIDNNHGITNVGPGMGSFTSKLTGLLPNTTYYVRAYATNIAGTNYGEHEVFTTTSDGTGIVTDIDGNVYSVIIIGNQEWMGENLKTTHYRNGTPIEYPGVDYTAWDNNTTGAYAWHNNDIIWKDTFGALYNWYAVNNSSGLCPAGWHVPDHNDWTQLEQFICNQLGNENCESQFPYDITTGGWLGNNEGNALKSCRQVSSPLYGDCDTSEHPRWESSSIQYGTDEFGFSALPSGYLGYGDVFFMGNWWSSTSDEQSISRAWSRSMVSSRGAVRRNNTASKKNAFSVRCVRDSDIPTLTTTPVNDITSTSAVSGGNTIDDGGAYVNSRGVVWSRSPNPTIVENEGFTNDGFGSGEFTSTITGLASSTTVYVRAYATNSSFTVYGQQEIFKTEDSGGNNGDDTQVVEVFNPKTGKTWMDRNLGASHAATSSTDNEAYGHLYQWGRATDGHQFRTSGNASNLVNSDAPGHGNFILAPNSPYDWRSPQNDNLWQGGDGINNPCPASYRLPTEAELNAERLSWSNNNAAGAFASPLKLPVAGGRDYSSGSLYSVGYFGYYWTSTVAGTNSRYLLVGSSNAGMSSSYRANGRSVRCIKYIIVNLPTLTTSTIENITPNSATGGGSITSDGGSVITSRGVVWSTSQNPTIENNQGFTSDGAGAGSFTSNLTGLSYNTNYYVRAYATNSAGTAYGQQESFITEDSGGENGDDTQVVEVFNPTTGKTWMDRNLGASRAATSSTDAEAYGGLYQWGRAADGHQKRTSGTTSTLSNSDTPGHGNFITVNSSPYDWRSPQNTNLWQGVNGTNNPCPVGYRLPTEAELNAERQSWSSNNSAGAFNSPLKLPVAGVRTGNNGSLLNVGSLGYYWSSTVGGASSRSLNFSNYASMYSIYHADGLSVRCLKD